MTIVCTPEFFDFDDFPASWQVVKNPHQRILTEAEILAMIQEHQPVGICAGVEPLTRNVLERATHLKVISRYGAGLDSVDLNAARELGINVYYTPDAPVTAVAEHAIGLILSLMRHIHSMDAGMRRHQWKPVQGSTLAGKTVGILGCGRIGTYTATLAAAFGCRVLGYDPYVTTHPICGLRPLPRVLAEADILSLHIPVTEDTLHFIGQAQLRQMKSTALLINTGRGKLIDTAALIEALTSGTIAGAALDVYEEEPYDGPVMDLPADRTLLTPHVASNTRETRVQMEQETVNNLMQGLQHCGLMP